METSPEAAQQTSTEARPSVSEGEKSFDQVAACLDGSELGERVIAHALAVARALGARLTLLRVLEEKTTPGALPDPLGWHICREEGRDYLERLADLRARNGPVDTEVIEGQVAEQICLWARRHQTALTVLCSHGASGATEWSLASTARKLVEGAPGSFLLVPATSAPVEGAARYRRVLVPVDGSALAESVLPLARRIAGAHGAELILAHVVPEPVLTEIGPLDAHDLELRDQLRERNERVANEYLDRLRAQRSEGNAPVRSLVLRAGHARSRMVRLIAEQDIDLVVLSAHGRTARTDLPFGSMTAYLMAHATAPLLIVRRPTAASLRHLARPEPEGVRLPSQRTA